MTKLTHPSPQAPAGVSADRAWLVVSALALGHMLVDAASIYVAMRLAMAATTPADPLWIIAAYNCLAFAPQAALGGFVDRLRCPAPAAAAGALMAVAAALLWPDQPMLALWLAGLGNALYHVGAGSLVLQLARGRAAMGGVLVGPGDLGVVLGTFMGSGGWPGAGVLLVTSALLAVCVAFIRLPAAPGAPSTSSARRRSTRAASALAILLLLLAIGSRQFVGGALNGPWFAQPQAWILMAVAAMVGKMTFGFLADRCGWMLTGAGLAALAAPLVALGPGYLGLSLAAALLAQAAMPVTLAALSRVLPQRPALAFGLASSALWLGGLPTDPLPHPLHSSLLLAVQLTAACAIAAALLLLRRKADTAFTTP
jgi:MFS transporter, FSR family, fosmidomycin resistance protein